MKEIYIVIYSGFYYVVEGVDFFQDVNVETIFIKRKKNYTGQTLLYQEDYLYICLKIHIWRGTLTKPYKGLEKVWNEENEKHRMPQMRL